MIKIPQHFCLKSLTVPAIYENYVNCGHTNEIKQLSPKNVPAILPPFFINIKNGGKIAGTQKKKQMNIRSK